MTNQNKNMRANRMKTMGRVKTTVRNFHKPKWWIDSVIPFIKYKQKLAIRGLTRYWFDPTNPECEFMSEDWDNAIILDACRFDQFKQLNTIDGDLKAVTSLGSSTPEFLSKNFSNSSFHDTVYVTANPQYRKRDLGNVFHDVIDVWDSGWNNQLRTIPPENVFEAAKNAFEEYPNKRLVVHFMQPHYPFIGEGRDKIGEHSGLKSSRTKILGGEATRDHDTVWEQLRQGKLSKQIVWRAYNENLKIVLPYVEKLISKFSGKSVVTSDHGNLLGEKVPPLRKPVYGHPTNVYSEGLRKVPWLVIESDSRKKIHCEPPQTVSDVDSATVSERLADLGYV